MSFQAFADKAHADGKKSVVFVGENHEDPGAHNIELDLAKKLLHQVILFGLSYQLNGNLDLGGGKIEMNLMPIAY